MAGLKLFRLVTWSTPCRGTSLTLFAFVGSDLDVLADSGPAGADSGGGSAPATPRPVRARSPSQLWQRDCKSPKGWGAPVGPLSVLDDDSHDAIALFQTGTTRAEAVRGQFEHAFTLCEMPEALPMEHGTPWWNPASAGGWTQFTVGLMQSGVRLYLSGIRHPQTGIPADRFWSVG